MVGTGLQVTLGAPGGSRLGGAVKGHAAQGLEVVGEFRPLMAFSVPDAGQASVTLLPVRVLRPATC